MQATAKSFEEAERFISTTYGNVSVHAYGPPPHNFIFDSQTYPSLTRYCDQSLDSDTREEETEQASRRLEDHRK